MKVQGYLQIDVCRNTRGEPRRLKLGRVTQGFPREPQAGSIVVAINLDVSGALLTPHTLTDKVPPGAGTIVLTVKENEPA